MTGTAQLPRRHLARKKSTPEFQAQVILGICRDVEFPTPSWRLIAEGFDRGSDCSTQTLLSRLDPTQLYRTPNHVLQQMKLPHNENQVRRSA